MRKTILFLFLLSLSAWCYSQTIKSKIRHYSSRDYGKGRMALNYAGAQDSSGILYFGNAGGVLRYNGVSWSYIPIKNQSVWVKSLAVSDDNIVYVGAQGEFGYLAPDHAGSLSYISLSDSLSADQSGFSDIICLWAWNDNVAFQSEEAIFLYSGGTITAIYPETSFHVSFLVNDELFVRQRGTGIMKLSGNKLQKIEGSSFLKDHGIFSIIESHDRKSYIVLTREIGFWSVDKQTFRASLIETEDSTLFRQSVIYGAIRLKDGRIAVNTLANGILFTDDSFRIESVINRDNGLKVNVTNSLFEDYQGNIWASLDNGIAQIYYESPLSLFGAESGITGNVTAIKRYKGNLFIGTTEGLFVQNNDIRTLSTAFIPFNNFRGEIRALCHVDDRMIAGTREGLFEIINNQVRKIDDAEVNTLYFSERLKTLFVSVRENLLLYQHSGGWKRVQILPAVSENIVRFEEEIDDKGVTLWLGTPLQGIVRLRFTMNNECFIDKYNSGDGLIDNDWSIPFKINSKVVFSQRNGLLVFIDENAIRETLPDSLKERPEMYRGYFDLFSIDTAKDRIAKPFYVIEDTGERIYVNLDGDLGYFDKINSYTFVDKPFRSENIGMINTVFRENSGFCWIGGEEGLLMFNENGYKDYTIDFKALITGVSAGRRDSVIYYGNHSGYFSRKKPEIKHYLNTLTFTYAAPFFEGQEKMLYSYMLSGQDTAFSPWDKDNRVVIGNLWEGDYAFRVRAMNIYGHISSEDSFEFRILSPWFRKPWAYIIYFLLLCASVYAVIRIYARRLIEKNKRLEEIIRERTREIQAKNAELQMQKEDILASINYAQRIQTAVLPSDDLVQSWLGDHFIIFRPKDIVSGDFYWTNIYNQYVVFCVADCTGHGVPGAFMSMLCISFLNEVVIKEKVIQPDKILDKVRILIIESLKQKGLRGEQKDGMDIAICVYNKETSELEFSGANNPLYIIRKKDEKPLPSDRQYENEEYILYEIKADRMPIAIFDNMEQFNRRTLKLLKQDRLYMFSDGVVDQFGGPAGKKFTNKALINALMETVSPDMKEQQKLIEEKIDKWHSFIDIRTDKPHIQIDDICIMGIII